ncbi:MAG: hypothetical protein JNN13_02435 [Planctomycetes bacterium]|nr:hypothetical protein [Planctomycetota bacterium]
MVIRSLRLALALALGGALLAQRTPDEALQALKAGNQRFASGQSLPQPLGEGVRRTLARGQSPFAIVVCCADSRVPPEHVFNTGLGELFVVRVAGNVADAELIASIEYAVEHLNTPLCVVLGHESCGAVKAAVAQGQNQRHDGESLVMQQLLEHIEPAVRKAQARSLGGKDLTDACEEENAHTTVHETMRRSELLRRYASVGKFRMVAARYHLDSGGVEWLPDRPLPAAPDQAAHLVPGAVPTGVPPHVALRMLQAGHRRFLGDGLPTADLSAERREQLTHGQHPLAIVLTCADSRVAPEHVFDAGLGELFVIRIAGNVLNDDALASIEYAAGHAGTSLLVVMGHSKCGAISAAAADPAGTELSPNLRALLTRLEPSVAAARAKGGKDVVDLAVRGNALRAVAEARSRSSLLRQLEAEGRFTMLAAVYDIASGDLEWLKDKNDLAISGRPAPIGAQTHGVLHGSPGTTPDPHDHEHGPAAVAPTTATHGDAAAHGDGDAHDAHDAHGAHGANDEAHGHAAANSHGLAAKDLPILDWAAAPSGETAAPKHAAPAPEAGHAAGPGHEAHAATEAPDAHEAAAAHDEHRAAAPHDAHGSPADHGADADHDPEPTATPALRWTDPTVLIGITGVVSLLAAAVLAMRKR